MKAKVNSNDRPKERAGRRLREAAVKLPGVGRTYNVRVAKAQLSGLLDLVAEGEEVVLTSGGKPKARLIPYKKRGRPFRVDWEHLRSMPVNTGPGATEIVRADRDARGW